MPDTPGEPRYVIWSNQHTMWWRARRAGYTGILEEAGRYSHAEAQAITDNATLGGQLKYSRVNPVSGQAYWMVDEALMLAPEHVAAATSARWPDGQPATVEPGLQPADFGAPGDHPEPPGRPDPGA